MIKDHILYNKDDFTVEEIRSENQLAVAVLKGKMKICKYCGKVGEELEGKCESKLCEKRRIENND